MTTTRIDCSHPGCTSYRRFPYADYTEKRRIEDEERGKWKCVVHSAGGPLENVSRRQLKASFIEAFGESGSEKRKRVTMEVCNRMGSILQQEYKEHDGRMWLWTLGKPARPLTDQEIADQAGLT